VTRGRLGAPTRRALLQGGGAMLAASLIGCDRSPTSETKTVAGAPLNARLRETVAGPDTFIEAGESPLMLGANDAPTPAWLYGGSPFPVLRARARQEMSAELVNNLSEHTSIHWHGVRVPNAMDGVPYVTQMPVLPREHFAYVFAPPDPGTFFFHPHCNTIAQLGRGLAGVLIVEGDEKEPFDDDVVLVLKDWRVAGDGSFLPFLTVEGAARSGSYGTLRTVNGAPSPRLPVPAGANIRMRLVNADSTRAGELGIEGASASVIAIDGNAIEPFELETWRLGPAMRLDLALRTPDDTGEIALMDYFAAEPVRLATLVAEGARRRSDSFVPPSLDAPSLPEPNLTQIRSHQLRLSATAAASTYPDIPPLILPDGRRIDMMDSFCATPRTLWAVDGKTWPEAGHQRMPPPLLSLARGESVRIEFLNTTPHLHPMHLHGHTFKVLSSSRLERPVHWADTVLVMPNERVQIAFVADNPGNWMLHCHIIEHQDTGMMGWFHVA
jgi:FtsP/CotA-like multicopper oxidase with cupredoxin domain